MDVCFHFSGRYLGVELLFDPLKSCQTVSKVATQVYMAVLSLHAGSCAGRFQHGCVDCTAQ